MAEDGTARDGAATNVAQGAGRRLYVSLVEFGVYVLNKLDTLCLRKGKSIVALFGAALLF